MDMKQIYNKLREFFSAGQTAEAEDFLIENNREFHRFLEAEGVEHIYNETPGQHDMDYWNEYVQKYVPIMFG